MPTQSDTTTEMGRTLRSAREERGWSLDEATFQVRMKFPRLKIGRGQIVSAEKGMSRNRIDPSVIVGLAALYDLSLTELDPAIADEIEALTEVFSQNSPCPPDFPPRGRFHLADAA